MSVFFLVYIFHWSSDGDYNNPNARLRNNTPRDFDDKKLWLTIDATHEGGSFIRGNNNAKISKSETSKKKIQSRYHLKFTALAGRT